MRRAPGRWRADAVYTCSFDAVITATETDIVTAIAVDDDGTEDTDDDDATVTVKPAEFASVVAGPVCDGDVPYLGYSLSVIGTDSDTATITFLHPSDPSQNVVHSGLPLARARSSGREPSPPDSPVGPNGRAGAS